MTDYEKAWDEFWAPIVCDPDGTVNWDKLKRELFDYRTLMGSVPRVYMHVTGGRVSKPNTDPGVVCQLADEREQEAIDEAVSEEARRHFP